MLFNLVQPNWTSFEFSNCKMGVGPIHLLAKVFLGTRYLLTDILDQFLILDEGSPFLYHIPNSQVNWKDWLGR